MTWTEWTAIGGLVIAGLGLIGTAYGLHQAGKQIAQAGDVALGDLLMSIDQILLQYHNDVHVRLRPGGEWDSFENPGAGPRNAPEWAAVETYMGLFERIYILMERGMIPKDLVRRFYSYRVGNIVANETICRKKLVSAAGGWQDFIALCAALDVDIPCRQPGTT